MNYTPVKVLDAGGFGRVWEMIGDDNVHYALKELMNPNTVNKARFDRELGILSRLDHPNIVKIIEWNKDGNPPRYGPWYTMELLQGGSLRNKMKDMFPNNVFSRKYAIDDIMLPICDALKLAHSQGIFHRDLKPENIMFTAETESSILKVIDWGLGKDPNRTSIALTQVLGGVGGTPGYCAPEQWFSLDNIDGRADIFSLGVILYEMMTGKRPPHYNNNLTRPNIPLPSSIHRSISKQMENCILKMLELQPTRRQQTATAGA